MFFLLLLLFCINSFLLFLGSREGFCHGNSTRSVLASFPRGNILRNCHCFLQTLSIQQLAKQTKPIEMKGPRTIPSCNSRPSSFRGLNELFSSWPDYQGTGNTSTKPRDLLLFEGKVARDWTMSVLEHHVFFL